MNYTVQRRRIGLILGLALGGAYSVSSNLINIIALPDIPLYAAPPGTFGLIVLTTSMFGALGLISAWTDESLPSVLLSALVGSVASSIWIFAHETSNKVGTLALLVIIFLPRMFFYLPFSGTVRWLISRLEAPVMKKNQAPVQKLIPVFVVFILFAVVGLFSLYSRETRQSLVKMDELIRLGMQASSREELPKSLQSVNGFTSRAEGAYTFLIGSDPDVLPVQRPVVEYGESEPFVIVRFENGFRFGCVFSPPYIVPACIDF